MPLSPETGLGPDKNPEIVFPFPAGDRESKEEPMSEYRRDDTASWDAQEVRQAQGARREPTPAHHSKSRHRRRRRNSLAVLVGYLIFVLLASAILAGVGWMLGSDFCAFNRGALRETSVEVTAEDSVSTVADKLHDAGLIRYKWFFKFYAGISHADRKIGIGTYELNTEMDYRALILGMHNSSGNLTAETVTVTIPEGYTVQETIELLASKGVGTVEELTDACANYPFEDYTFLDSSKLGDISRMEGFLYPDTHEFYTGKAVLAIDTLLYAFQMQISEQMQADIQKSGYSLSEIVTMASMIEKESINDDAERKNIASVLYNRMNNSNGETAGFLQVDATIDYALKLQGKDHSSFTTSLDSPYNTYLHKGLPAGPICSPSLSSIKAAIYPNQTDYYFYALGKDGVHHFFKTYAEHLNFINSSDYQSIG